MFEVRCLGTMVKQFILFFMQNFKCKGEAGLKSSYSLAYFTGGKTIDVI